MNLAKYIDFENEMGDPSEDLRSILYGTKSKTPLEERQLNSCKEFEKVEREVNEKVESEEEENRNQKLDRRGARVYSTKVGGLQKPDKLQKKRTKKKKRRRIKVCNKAGRTVAKLFAYFQRRGAWKGTEYEDEADYTHFSSEKKVDYEMARYTLINRIPGVSFLSRKREHFFIINNYKKYFFDKDESSKYFPETFLIPEDYAKYKRVHQRHPRRVYISKSNIGSQGYGIKLVTKPRDLFNRSTRGIDDLIVQRYISKPLLIDGKKHDLRLYVLIASVDPFIAFINEEGLARFCAEDYENPSTENKEFQFMHLTNYSMNKNSENFIYTEELTKINNGSKRTLTSYWKSVREEGYDPNQIKEEIMILVQHLLKSMKPFLRYFMKCTYPKGEMGNCFHILGLDVIMDEQGKPWILEINANPSLNIEASGTSAKKERSENISPIDLHIKSMVLGHAVKLCLKSIQDIENYEEYDSYTQIFSPELEEEMFKEKNYFDDLLDIFLEVSGQRFMPSLTMPKFTKIARLFKGIGKRNINKHEVEICYKKMMNYHEQMDFYAFFDAVDFLLKKCYGDESELSAREQVAEFITQFRRAKKPLFYF